MPEDPVSISVLRPSRKAGMILDVGDGGGQYISKCFSIIRSTSSCSNISIAITCLYITPQTFKNISSLLSNPLCSPPRQSDEHQLKKYQPDSRPNRQTLTKAKQVPLLIMANTSLKASPCLDIGPRVGSILEEEGTAVDVEDDATDVVEARRASIIWRRRFLTVYLPNMKQDPTIAKRSVSHPSHPPTLLKIVTCRDVKIYLSPLTALFLLSIGVILLLRLALPPAPPMPPAFSPPPPPTMTPFAPFDIPPFPKISPSSSSC